MSLVQLLDDTAQYIYLTGDSQIEFFDIYRNKHRNFDIYRKHRKNKTVLYKLLDDIIIKANEYQYKPGNYGYLECEKEFNNLLI